MENKKSGDEFARRQYEIAKWFMEEIPFVTLNDDHTHRKIAQDTGIADDDLVSPYFKNSVDEIQYHLEQLKDKEILSISSGTYGIAPDERTIYYYHLTPLGQRWIVEGIKIEKAKPSKQKDKFDLKTLFNVLKKSFSRSALERMLRFELDENLDAIVKDTNIDDTVYQVIKWAEQYGRLSDLIEGAYRANPTSKDVCEFVEDYFGELPEVAH